VGCASVEFVWSQSMGRVANDCETYRIQKNIGNDSIVKVIGLIMSVIGLWRR